MIDLLYLLVIIHISYQLATLGIGAEVIVLVKLVSTLATMIDLFIRSGNVFEV